LEEQQAHCSPKKSQSKKADKSLNKKFAFDFLAYFKATITKRKKIK
jgi:hypothetical protein